MTVYIALIRGINVGGKNRIKMDDLKRTFEALGLSRVQTYIQSGNVLFESNEEEEPLCRRIEREIETVFGISASVMLRTSAELKGIAANCPFTERELAEAAATAKGESLHVAMLPEAPQAEGIERLSGYKTDNDEFRIEGRDVYLLFRDSILTSKIAANLHRLGVPATVRNWNTVGKLTELAKAMEE